MRALRLDTSCEFCATLRRCNAAHHAAASARLLATVATTAEEHAGSADVWKKIVSAAVPDR